ncbi:MAG: hypothetical protein JXR89_05260 [Deltaproteobacteria bacterium]|nr:hypothetical protein [Deltaproteobacteria bacterium]
MVSRLDASLNALHNHLQRLQTSAANIANLNTDGYQSRRLTINEGPAGTTTTTLSADTSPGPVRLEPNRDGTVVETQMANVDLAGEYVKIMTSTQAVKANLKAAATVSELLGEVIDTLA